MHFTNNQKSCFFFRQVRFIYTFSSTLPPKLRMLHSKLFSVTPILTRVWKLGGPSKFSSGTIRIAWGNHVYPSEGFYQNRAPNLWTTGQKPLKCLHQKVSKRTSEACQNRKRPDTHSKLTSARAIYRKIQSKSCGSTYFYILPLLFPVGTVPKWHSKFRSVTIYIIIYYA
jgi:hypothetical protein